MSGLTLSVVKRSPEDIPREALVHLNNAIIKGDSDYTLQDVLHEAEAGGGTLFSMETDRVVGAMYLQKYPDAIHIVLLGGEKIIAWKKQLVAFFKQTMREEGVRHVCVLGRRGWNGLFSELKPIGTLYIHEDDLT